MSGFSVNACNFYYIVAKTDYEWHQIINKLKKYGIASSKNRSQDILVLRGIELKELKNEDCSSTKFLTLNKSEIADINEENKKECTENNLQALFESQTGAKILGEQMYFAIMLKKENESNR